MRKIIVAILVGSFIVTSIQVPAWAQFDSTPSMPQPGMMVHLSPEFSPAYLVDLEIHLKLL